MTAYTEDRFNALLDNYGIVKRLLELQHERAEMHKAAFTIMEGHRDFWKDLYKRTEADYDSLRESVAKIES